MSSSIRIVEVGPRDGLQNEERVLTPLIRAQLVQHLAACGLRHIEAGAFVSPHAVPQMQNTEQVLNLLHKWQAAHPQKRAEQKQLKRKPPKQNPPTQNQPEQSQQVEQSRLRRDSPPRPHLKNKAQLPRGLHLPCLVPNLRGLQRALQCEVREVAFFASSTESFSHRNINCTIEQSLVRLKELLPLVRQHRLKLRAYLSVAFGCPYEGSVSMRRVIKLIDALLTMGAYEVSVGDTIGVARPGGVKKLLRSAKSLAPHLAMHFHDTYGMGLANVLQSLDLGVRVFDASVGGLGGCPYAQPVNAAQRARLSPAQMSQNQRGQAQMSRNRTDRVNKDRLARGLAAACPVTTQGAEAVQAMGNIATENVVALLQSLGLAKGISVPQLLKTRTWIEKKLGRQLAAPRPIELK